MNSGSSKSSSQQDFEQLNALLNEAPGDEASEEEVQAFFEKVLTEEGGEEMLKRLASAVQGGASLDPAVEERRSLAAVYQKPSGDFRLVAKADLLEVSPVIWRRLSLPSTSSFFDIHCAIQDAFGWEDRHSHQFELRSPDGQVEASFGIGSGEAESDDDYCGVRNRAIDLFSEGVDTFHYRYQSPDDWSLLVKFEKVYQPDAGSQERLSQASLIGGQGFAPPEDVGGIAGFREFLAGRHPLSASHDRDLLQQWPRATITPESVSFRDPLAVLRGDGDA